MSPRLQVVDEQGTLLRGSGVVDSSFADFNRMRRVGDDDYPVLLFTHTTFTDRAPLVPSSPLFHSLRYAWRAARPTRLTDLHGAFSLL